MANEVVEDASLGEETPVEQVDSYCLLARTALQYGTLSEDAQASAEAHKATCVKCQQYFAAIQQGA